MLDDRRQDAQQDKDEQDRDIQAVVQQELLDVERVFVVFPLLLLFFAESESGQPQQVNQVVTVRECFVLPVLDFLQRGFMLQLCVEKPVLVNIFLFFQLGAGLRILEVFLVLGLSSSSSF